MKSGYPKSLKKMTHLFQKELPFSLKNDPIVGENPVVRTQGKQHQPKKLWFPHFKLTQIGTKYPYNVNKINQIPPKIAPI